MRVLSSVALCAAMLSSCSTDASRSAGPTRQADSPKPKAAAEGTVDMESWETQVLGAIHGTYCGYYPDRLSIAGRAIGLTSFKQCSTFFAALAPVCVNRMKSEGKWHVSSSPEGTRLGAELGTCIDAGFQAAMRNAQGGNAPR